MSEQNEPKSEQTTQRPILQQMPKVELHSHLDCTLSFDAVSQLVPGITEREYREKYVAPEQCDTLVRYLEHTRHGVALQQSRQALQLVVQDLFNQLAQENVIYTEIRFAPFLHTGQGLSIESVV